MESALCWACVIYQWKDLRAVQLWNGGIHSTHGFVLVESQLVWGFSSWPIFFLSFDSFFFFDEDLINSMSFFLVRLCFASQGETKIERKRLLVCFTYTRVRNKNQQSTSRFGFSTPFEQPVPVLFLNEFQSERPRDEREWRGIRGHWRKGLQN